MIFSLYSWDGEEDFGLNKNSVDDQTRKKNGTRHTLKSFYYFCEFGNSDDPFDRLFCFHLVSFCTISRTSSTTQQSCYFGFGMDQSDSGESWTVNFNENIICFSEDDYGNAFDADCITYRICSCTVTSLLQLLDCLQLLIVCHWSDVHGIWMRREILSCLLSNLFQKTSNFTSLRTIDFLSDLSTSVVFRTDRHLLMWNRIWLHTIGLCWCMLSIRGMFQLKHQKCSGGFSIVFVVHSQRTVWRCHVKTRPSSYLPL
jgi:hypothetical protein